MSLDGVSCLVGFVGWFHSLVLFPRMGGWSACDSLGVMGGWVLLLEWV